ncbi:MAG: DMT family transporter [Halofilum sp. (in: g-proteobacteria)]|nr:DMT family transporter [Halofilum sp. (in: g-proteobacteria)]
MRAHHLAAVVVIMALFGSAYPIGKLAVGHFPPFAFATLRSTILALALLPLWRLARPPRRLVLPLAGFCAAMGVGVYATMYTALSLSATVAPIVIGTQLAVPFAVLLGRLLLGERVRPVTWAAIAAAFGGIVVIAFGPGLLADLPALGVITLSALCYATATLCARSLRHLSPFTMNGWMAATAIVPLALLSLALEQGQWRAVVTADAATWAVLAHSALAVSLLGHVGMFSLYRHYPVASVIPYYVLMPVFGVAFSLVLFAEVPSAQTLAGGVIVVAATWAVNRTTVPPAAAAPPDPEPLEFAPDPRASGAPEQDDT